MPNEIRPDMSCVPYSRRCLYLVLTIPFVLILILIFIYLWSFHFVLAIVFISFYITANLFQAYCCAYQACPYIGRFCPAVAGIIPSSLFAGIFYGKTIKRTKARFNLFATIAFFSLLGLAIFPLFWIAKISIKMAICYLIFNALYYVAFFLIICPVCAIRNTCPGGKLQDMVLGK